MRIDFFSFRKLFWPINAITYNLCRLIPFRSRRIWVFGCLSGNGYSDNAKYLFEYVNEVHSSDIKAVWLSNTREVVEDLRRNQYTSYLTYSFKGMWYALRCGVAVYTHGLSDFGYMPLVGGAKVVSLWHGVGFKKIYNASYQGICHRFKTALDKVFSWTKRDCTMVTSEYTKKQFKILFNLDEKDIFITGQPRNDVFKKDINCQTLRKSLGIGQDKKIILYMPTYRNKWQGEKVIDNIIKDLVDCKVLNEVLETYGYLMMIKLHPLTPVPDVPITENFRIIEYGDIKFNQELLVLGDILITDYSSCFVDYSLLHRPIIFYVPDMEDYLNSTGGMDQDFFDLCDICRCQTPEDLSNQILHPSVKVAQLTNCIFEDVSIQGSCYSENVYRVINKI